MISFSRFFNRILCGLLVLVGLLFVQVGQIRAENCAECGGYWVVSTYSLPQQPGCCPQTFPFSCYYKPVKGSLRPSSVSEMSQSLNPSAPTALFVHGSFVNIDKITGRLGFAPQHSNQEALIRNYDWYVANRARISAAAGVTHRVPWKRGALRLIRYVL